MEFRLDGFCEGLGLLSIVLHHQHYIHLKLSAISPQSQICQQSLMKTGMSNSDQMSEQYETDWSIAIVHDLLELA